MIPFLVELVHGLAGSAGRMLVVLATIPSPALGSIAVGLALAWSIGVDSSS